MGASLSAEIRERRRNGDLLGPLVERYGADAVVDSLGSQRIACDLGVCEHPNGDEESDDADDAD